MRKRMVVSASKKRKNTNSCAHEGSNEGQKRKKRRRGYYKSWESHKDELIAFQRKFGHTNNPRTYSTNKQLGLWVTNQRQQHKLFTDGKPNSLTQEQINQLETLRFDWCLRQKGKKKKYQKTKAQKLKELVRVNTICRPCLSLDNCRHPIYYLSYSNLYYFLNAL